MLPLLLFISCCVLDLFFLFRSFVHLFFIGEYFNLGSITEPNIKERNKKKITQSYEHMMLLLLGYTLLCIQLCASMSLCLCLCVPLRGFVQSSHGPQTKHKTHKSTKLCLFFFFVLFHPVEIESRQLRLMPLHCNFGACCVFYVHLHAF